MHKFVAAEFPSSPAYLSDACRYMLQLRPEVASTPPRKAYKSSQPRERHGRTKRPTTVPKKSRKLRNQGPDLQNILRQSCDYLTTMP